MMATLEDYYRNTNGQGLCISSQAPLQPAVPSQQPHQSDDPKIPTSDMKVSDISMDTTDPQCSTWNFDTKSELSENSEDILGDDHLHENNITQPLAKREGSSSANRKNSSRKNPWGNLSYADLITKAIESSPEKRLTLSQIYEWMVKFVPYFRDKGDSNSSAGWKNSIRHNLSLHDRFMRIQNEGTGKSSWWVINPDARPGKSARRRAAPSDGVSNKFEKKRGRAKKKAHAIPMNGWPMDSILHHHSTGNVVGELGIATALGYTFAHDFPLPGTREMDTRISPLHRQYSLDTLGGVGKDGGLGPYHSSVAYDHMNGHLGVASDPVGMARDMMSQSEASLCCGPTTMHHDAQAIVVKTERGSTTPPDRSSTVLSPHMSSGTMETSNLHQSQTAPGVPQVGSNYCVSTSDSFYMPDTSSVSHVGSVPYSSYGASSLHQNQPCLPSPESDGSTMRCPLTRDSTNPHYGSPGMTGSPNCGANQMMMQSQYHDPYAESKSMMADGYNMYPNNHEQYPCTLDGPLSYASNCTWTLSPGAYPHYRTSDAWGYESHYGAQPMVQAPIPISSNGMMYHHQHSDELPTGHSNSYVGLETPSNVHYYQPESLLRTEIQITTAV